MIRCLPNKPVDKDRVVIRNIDKMTTVVEIPLSKLSKVSTVVAESNSNRESISSMKHRVGCDYMINGGFFWTDNKGKSHSLNLLISDYTQNNAGTYSKFGMCVYDDNKIKFQNYKWTKELQHMIGGSPRLVQDGKKNLSQDIVSESNHPRSAIGITHDNLILLTVDGRRQSQGLKGVPLSRLADIMLEVKCIDAIALDGGGSTRLESKDKVLNNPSENRAVHNAIGVWVK